MVKGKIKKIHFVGIKGVGMTPLAIIAKEAGFEVTGSDVSEVFITDEELQKSGIKVYEGFASERVKGADLVIATAAHGGSQNLEVKKAVEKNINVLTQGDALGLFQDGEILGKKFKGISIAGSHGKTTTTSMIATVLKENKMDPSYAIGTGNIPSLGGSGHFGKGQYFIAEADEYITDTKDKKIPKFLSQNPEIIVVTNIDFDHPDVYKSIDEIRDVFVEFTKKLPHNGVLIACGDGEENRKFLKEVLPSKITYGLSPGNDFSIEKIDYSPEKMFFWVKSKDTVLGQFSLNVFGQQNAINALGAIIVGLEVGLSVEQIRTGLSKFNGSKRRSELVGVLKNGARLYDDYAHHPKEIKETLSSFKKAFPKHKIIVIFQPHMYSRTKALFKDFISSFSEANEVIITEIFPSFREIVDKSFSSNLLVEEIKKYGKNAIYFPDLSDVVKYLTSQKLDKNVVILTMGAGDVYKIGKELMNGKIYS